jgi:biopolymer transport protein TolQ
MQGNVVDQVALGGTAAPHDLSILGLFLQADIVVKCVMLLLLIASFWSWAVIFDKVMRLRRLKRDAAKFEESFWSGGSLDDLYERVGNRPPDPMSAIFAAAMREWRRSAAKGLIGSTNLRASLQDRIERVMSVTVGREMERLERFMAYLATVGSTAPFVGLFGTVWGIMNSFIGISKSHTTNLAIVAPGIAEALLATAFGLAAAIPAVVIYNMFARWAASYRAVLGDATAETLRLVSRDLDRGLGAATLHKAAE